VCVGWVGVGIIVNDMFKGNLETKTQTIVTIIPQRITIHCHFKYMFTVKVSLMESSRSRHNIVTCIVCNDGKC